MLQGEHSAILSTFIKQPFVIKIFVLSIFERPLKTGFTVYRNLKKIIGTVHFLGCLQQVNNRLIGLTHDSNISLYINS